MKHLVGVAVCVLLIAADGKNTKVESKADGKKAAEALAGTWSVASAVVNGNEFDDAKTWKFVFAGDKLTRKTSDGDETYAFKLDPSKKPAEVDFVPDQGENKGKTLKGIYAAKEGELKICLTLSPEAKRPTELVSKDGEEYVLIVLKHEKK
jgi:uncharacterized protein (TIGR03067 family)